MMSTPFFNLFFRPRNRSHNNWLHRLRRPKRPARGEPQGWPRRPCVIPKPFSTGQGQSLSPLVRPKTHLRIFAILRVRTDRRLSPRTNQLGRPTTRSALRRGLVVRSWCFLASDAGEMRVERHLALLSTPALLAPESASTNIIFGHSLPFRALPSRAPRSCAES